MDRDKLITMMVRLLQTALADHAVAGAVPEARRDSPLVGGEAVITSMALVSFVTDVEATLAQDFDLEVTLVSEKALSRKNSPFRSIEALADYVLELAGAPVSAAE